jgi:hypothetical protein
MNIRPQAAPPLLAALLLLTPCATAQHPHAVNEYKSEITKAALAFGLELKGQFEAGRVEAALAEEIRLLVVELLDAEPIVHPPATNHYERKTFAWYARQSELSGRLPEIPADVEKLLARVGDESARAALEGEFRKLEALVLPEKVKGR